MRFRTEIESRKSPRPITHDDRIVLLGSCFADNVGARLQRDGFDMCFNPMGPLYNPVSLARLIDRLLNSYAYTPKDFRIDQTGVSHCLDFASRYQNVDADALTACINTEFEDLRRRLLGCSVLAVTFGSSFVYSLTGDPAGAVGNCHKFPSSMFKRMPVEPDAVILLWRPLLKRLHDMGIRVIMTVSPIRHLADGLHGNQLSKARLLLACDALTDDCHTEYFPAYEIMMDDLRDYRFYDRDLKHPSEVACDYIYEKFGERYFSALTLQTAAKQREAWLRSAHRSIISD